MPGRREQNIAIGGLGAAAVGGVGVRAALGPVQRSGRAVRQAEGRLGERVAARNTAVANLRERYQRARSVERDLNLARATGAPGAPKSKKAMREAMGPYNRSTGAFKPAARRAGAGVRQAQAGLKAAKKAQVRSRVGLAAMGGLTVAGLGTAGYGAVQAERKRVKAADRMRRREQAAMNNVVAMTEYRDTRQMKDLRPKRPREGNRKFVEDPATGKYKPVPSRAQAMWDEATASQKADIDARIRAANPWMNE